MIRGQDALLAALEGGLGGGGEVELSYAGGRTGPTRFANSGITQSGVVDDALVQARVVLGRRIGTCRGNRVDRASLAELTARARALAELAPEVEGFTGLPAPLPIPSAAGAWDEETATASPGWRADRLREAFAEVDALGATCAGVFSCADLEVAVVSSRGIRAYHRGTSAKLDVIVTEGRASGYATALSRAVGRIDVLGQARRAGADHVRMRDPVSIAPGPLDVVLAPPAVGELLEWLSSTGFSARTFENGSSFLCGRTGQPVMAAGVTIRDAGLSGAPEGLPIPFDCEGVPKREVLLVDRGLGGAAVHDTLSAARAGTTSTGHAPPFENDADGPVAGNLEIAAGEDDEPALIARVERGLFVTRLHYVNGLLDTRRALMTGMTRDGVFLIEDGRITRGIRNLRFTDSMLEAFSRTGGITRERRAVAPWWAALGAFVVPTVLLHKLRFTGAS